MNGLEYMWNITFLNETPKPEKSPLYYITRLNQSGRGCSLEGPFDTRGKAEEVAAKQARSNGGEWLVLCVLSAFKLAGIQHHVFMEAKEV